MDWKNIIHDLVESGLTQKQIADHAKVSQSVVSDLVRGKQRSVEWGIGETLLALHRVHCVQPAA